MSLAKCSCLLAIVVLVLHVLPESGRAAAVSRPSARTFSRQMLRKFFNCPCHPESCPALRHPGCETVMETGVCACCPVCAKMSGERCGLRVGRCGKGLNCRPSPEDPDPLGAILSGRAVCTP